MIQLKGYPMSFKNAWKNQTKAEAIYKSVS